MTFEAMIKNVQVVLPTDIHLPENTRVFVVVPQPVEPQIAVTATPHLTYPEQASHFQLQVSDAGPQHQ